MFGITPFWAVIAVFVVTYITLIAERINRALVVLAGAGVLIFTGLMSLEQVHHAIDFKTISLLAGMMAIVAVTRETGLFQYLAIRGAQLVKGHPVGFFVMLGGVTALLSALLDNVTTVLLLTPVTLSICRSLAVPRMPYLMCLILMSNIGGTATLVGDPPNIMIGNAVGLSFNAFLANLTPLALLVTAVTLVLMVMLWGRQMKTTPEARQAIMAACAADEIRDVPLLVKCLTVIGAVMLGFFTHSFTHFEPSLLAFYGGVFLLLLKCAPLKESKKQHELIHGVFMELELLLLVFFGGLFVLVGGLEHYGVISTLAKGMMSLSGGDLFTTAMILLWGSALFSAVVDNIPFVATMIPLVQDMAAPMGGPEAIKPLWWALAAGACFGGNGSLIGASANLVVAGLSEAEGQKISFREFLMVGFPLMLVSIVISTGYIWLRYF